MNIPRSAIEPFGVIGIPNIDYELIAMDKLVRIDESLDMWWGHFRGEPPHIASNLLLMRMAREVAKRCGAEMVHSISHPARRGHPPSITLHYNVSGNWSTTRLYR